MCCFSFSGLGISNRKQIRISHPALSTYSGPCWRVWLEIFLTIFARICSFQIIALDCYPAYRIRSFICSQCHCWKACPIRILCLVALLAITKKCRDSETLICFYLFAIFYFSIVDFCEELLHDRFIIINSLIPSGHRAKIYSFLGRLFVSRRFLYQGITLQLFKSKNISDRY